MTDNADKLKKLKSTIYLATDGPIADDIVKIIQGAEAEIAELTKQRDELKEVMQRIQDDLLMRGEIDKDGTRVVNVSCSVWSDFCDALPEPPEEPSK